MEHYGEIAMDAEQTTETLPSASVGSAVTTAACMDGKSASSEALPPNRFELELEFIQCLASPAYLHHLATSGYLADPIFLQFLQYLKYWKNPEYVRFISYPHCLYFLDLLCDNEAFRREIANIGFRNFVHEQQFYSWQFRSKNLYGCGMANNFNSDKNNEPDNNPENTSNNATNASTAATSFNAQSHDGKNEDLPAVQ